MFVRIKEKPNGKKAVQIVESYRRADKDTQKIIRHIGQAATERELDELKRLAESIIIEVENQHRMMDRLKIKEDEIRERIAQATLSLFPDRVDILFFDVTTLYFESIETDDLREFGYSKDCKFCSYLAFSMPMVRPKELQTD